MTIRTAPVLMLLLLVHQSFRSRHLLLRNRSMLDCRLSADCSCSSSVGQRFARHKIIIITTAAVARMALIRISSRWKTGAHIYMLMVVMLWLMVLLLLLVVRRMMMMLPGRASRLQHHGQLLRDPGHGRGDGPMWTVGRGIASTERATSSVVVQQQRNLLVKVRRQSGTVRMTVLLLSMVLLVRMMVVVVVLVMPMVLLLLVLLRLSCSGCILLLVRIGGVKRRLLRLTLILLEERLLSEKLSRLRLTLLVLLLRNIGIVSVLLLLLSIAATTPNICRRSRPTLTVVLVALVQHLLQLLRRHALRQLRNVSGTGIRRSLATPASGTTAHRLSRGHTLLMMVVIELGGRRLSRLQCLAVLLTSNHGQLGCSLRML